MREAILIRRDDLAERQRNLTDPAEPTLDRITPAPFGPFSQHAVDCHLNLSGLTNMQMRPGENLDRLARFVVPLPLLVKFPQVWGLLP